MRLVGSCCRYSDAMTNTAINVKFLHCLTHYVISAFHLGHWWCITVTHAAITYSTPTDHTVLLGASGVDECCRTVHGISRFVLSIRLLCLSRVYFVVVVVLNSRSHSFLISTSEHGGTSCAVLQGSHLTFIDDFGFLDYIRVMQYTLCATYHPSCSNLCRQ